MTHFTQIFR